MDSSEIKKANRKAMPKFIIILVISIIIGAEIGFFSAKYGWDAMLAGIKEAGTFFGMYIAPWLMLVIAVTVPAVSVPLYKKAKKLLASWDGEDENVYSRADGKLSVAIWLSSAALIVSYFLIAASYSGGFAALENEEKMPLFMLSIAAFLGIMIEAVIIQQKCIDCAKKTNPEKTASVYDTKFHKKWLDSCDEAEKLLIGKCAFKAFGATNNVCAILAILLALCAIIFGIGFLPSLVVCLIWIVNQSVYCKEALKYSKVGNKIS